MPTANLHDVSMSTKILANEPTAWKSQATVWKSEPLYWG